MARPLYRARQFFEALRPVVRRAELKEAEDVLGPRLMELFLSMAARDQRHCLDVCERLRAAGCEDSVMLTAALLHDTGKGALAGAKVRLWHRVAYVLLEALPGRGERTPVRWAARYSRGIAVLREHGERGAALAEAFGAPPEAVRLQREMEGAATADPRAAMLRAADDEA